MKTVSELMKQTVIDMSLQKTCDEHSSNIHDLKCWPKFFDAIAEGRKRHDLRRAGDRHFEVGDRLKLREFDPTTNSYSGRQQFVTVTYITSAEHQCALSEEALHHDYCILSISLNSQEN